MSETVVANVDRTITSHEMVFRFKKDKLGNKRADVKVNVAVPSVDGIVDILSRGDAKEVQLLLDACYDVVRGSAAGFVSDDENMTADNFPHDKVTWAAIAAQPKEDRRSSSISEEAWTAFCSDYIGFMPGATGKSEEAVTNATLVYRKKFAPWKTDKKTLEKLKAQLAIYIESAPGAEQHQEILDLLIRRVDAYLKTDDLVALAANL
jgi:hypothetical protein